MNTYNVNLGRGVNNTVTKIYHDTKKTYEISVEENNVNTKEEVLMRRDDVLHTHKVDV